MKKLLNELKIWLLPVVLVALIAGCKGTTPTAAENTPTPVATVAVNTATITTTEIAPLATATITATEVAPLATATVTATTIIAPSGQATVVLASAAGYAILSSSAITNIPSSIITGDVGLSPGLRAALALSIGEVSGTIYASDDADPVPANLTQAKQDALDAYLDATAVTRGTPAPVSGNLNGLTLYPGLYESGSSIEISPGGILYLDGQGDANAVFIIRSATSITTSGTSEVRLTNSTQAKNVYWTAGSAVTLGTYSIMKGTIIASTSIAIQTGASLTGRALIQSAAADQVTLDTATVTLP